MTIKTTIVCDKCQRTSDRAVELTLKGGAEATVVPYEDGRIYAIKSTAHYCLVCWKGKIRPALETLGIDTPEVPEGLQRPDDEVPMPQQPQAREGEPLPAAPRGPGFAGLD